MLRVGGAGGAWILMVTVFYPNNLGLKVDPDQMSGEMPVHIVW